MAARALNNTSTNTNHEYHNTYIMRTMDTKY